MGHALLSIVQPTIRSRNMPTTSSGTSWISAIPKASRIRQSLAKAGVRLLPTTRCWWWRPSARSRRRRRKRKSARQKRITSSCRDILEVKQRLKRGNRLESLHDIQQIKEESQQTFDLGLLDLESKAKIDAVYWQLAAQIVGMHRGLRFVPDEVKELETALGDQYICNFSVFQSLLDHWALGQLFPIMPIHRLTEPPERNGTIVDITCDSDGKVSKFIDLLDVRDTLPLHRIIPGEIYYLGVFMVGAYQDIMGDLHNLFGRVTEVHVFLDPDEESGWYIEEVIEGSTIGEVLAMTQWDKVELMRLLKSQVDAAIKTDRLKPSDAMKLLSDYERLLQEYTYLSLNGNKPRHNRVASCH